MFTSKAVLLILSAFLATINAAPSNLEAREAACFFLNPCTVNLLFTHYHIQDAAVTIKLCTAVNLGGTCATLTAVPDQCVSLTGGLSILNKEISSAVIPGGFICTFFE